MATSRARRDQRRYEAQIPRQSRPNVRLYAISHTDQRRQILIDAVGEVRLYLTNDTRQGQPVRTARVGDYCLLTDGAHSACVQHGTYNFFWLSSGPYALPYAIRHDTRFDLLAGEDMNMSYLRNNLIHRVVMLRSCLLWRCTQTTSEPCWEPVTLESTDPESTAITANMYFRDLVTQRWPSRSPSTPTVQLTRPLVHVRTNEDLLRDHSRIQAADNSPTYKSGTLRVITRQEGMMSVPWGSYNDDIAIALDAYSSAYHYVNNRAVLLNTGKIIKNFRYGRFVTFPGVFPDLNDPAYKKSLEQYDVVLCGYDWFANRYFSGQWYSVDVRALEVHVLRQKITHESKRVLRLRKPDKE